MSIPLDLPTDIYRTLSRYYGRSLAFPRSLPFRATREDHQRLYPPCLFPSGAPITIFDHWLESRALSVSLHKKVYSQPPPGELPVTYVVGMGRGDRWIQYYHHSA